MTGSRPPGGIRRDPGATTTTLTEAECLAVIRGADRARERGMAFNRFVTLLWKKGGIEERDAAASTQAFIKLASDWVRSSKKGRLAWAYTLEWGPTNGAHAHLLLHVPPALDAAFRRMPRRWAASLSPLDYVADLVRSIRLMGAHAPHGVSAGLYAHDLGIRVHYLLKAAPKDLEAPLGMIGKGRPDVEWGRFSLVHGKRSGAWQERRSDNPA